MAGVVLVAASQDAPAAVQLVTAGVRDAGIAGLGLALIRAGRLERHAPPPAAVATAGALP